MKTNDYILPEGRGYNGQGTQLKAIATCDPRFVITFNPADKGTHRSYFVRHVVDAKPIALWLKTIKQARAVAGALSGIPIQWTGAGEFANRAECERAITPEVLAWYISAGRGFEKSYL